MPIMWSIRQNLNVLWRTKVLVRRERTPNVAYYSRNSVFGYKPSARKTYPDSTEGSLATNSETKLKLLAWINAYRQHGHKVAALDPLGLQRPRPAPELDPAKYGLSIQDTSYYDVEGLLQSGVKSSSLGEVEKYLQHKYCGHIAAEFMHLRTETEREWFADRFEKVQDEEIPSESKTEMAIRMAKSQVFENFLAVKRQSLKRYGGEGSESQVAFFMQAFQQCAEAGIEEVFVCMAHRGRLNLLIDFFGFSPTVMFRKIDGLPEFPQSASCWGDVVSHLYCSKDLDYSGRKLHINFLPNPSHLESVNPVALGKTRGRLQTLKDGDFSDDENAFVGDKALCIQVHGDAAFCGQGIIQECFCLAELPHFTVGGSVHLIINNQLGFTTSEKKGRSSEYCTDIAKMNRNPVIHVNGDHPEEVVKACKVALDYRNTFRKDVLVDMVCFRLHGHNELDDPSMTQPTMYSVISSKKSVPDAYAEKVVAEGHMTSEELQSETTAHNDWLSNCLKETVEHEPEAFNLKRHWERMQPAPKLRTSWNTGVDVEFLRYIGMKSVEFPSDFTPHPGVFKSHVQGRQSKITSGAKVDWATAEALAMGSLLSQGFPIRISGQDVGRGTFSHRHATFIDQNTEAVYVPLNNLLPEQTAFLEVVNSPLSEWAVLGFEYGMSIEHPDRLVIWEAQFGDFFNTAQPIVDTFVTSGEGKWLLQSGLVMLLPHGMDGAGPEHSSCRIERFLQMCNSEETKTDTDDVNFHFCFPTTPAQYFHLLRLQMIRNFRKPLIMASPKGILRLPAATSSLDEMRPGTTFHPVLPDTSVDPSQVERVIFCTGKHYYALLKERNDRQLLNTALIRLECLCPFPTLELQQELNRYPSARDYIWSQEEHRNMGAWFFVDPRFQNLVGCKLKYAGRCNMGTTAVGVGEVHKAEAKMVIEAPFHL